MGRDQPITIGARFRDLKTTIFPDLIVEDVYVAGGIEHARRQRLFRRL